MTNETKPQGAAAPAAVTEGSSLLDDLLATSKLKPKDDGYDLAKRGVQEFIKVLLEPDKAREKVDKTAVEAMIAEIDAKLSAQVNEVLHHPDVQKLESSWRSLKYVVDHLKFEENVQLEVVSATKEELQADFNDAADITESGLYRTVYAREYGQSGGDPVGVVCANYQFGPGPQDLGLLSKCAAVSAMAQAPLITNAGAEFFEQESFETLAKVPNVKGLLEQQKFTRWKSFRENPDSRYVGLCMPRFLLRLPYNAQNGGVSGFNFTEDVSGSSDRFLWGEASNAMVTKIADSFAKYRWCPNIIGAEAGGMVEDLPLHQYEAMGQTQTRLPVETILPDKLWGDLADSGFVPLVFHKNSDKAIFYTANSAKSLEKFPNTPEGNAAAANDMLGTRLPYLFIITRLAHYLKVLERKKVGATVDRSSMEKRLNDWIGQYVSDMESPSEETRAVRPLRKASIKVEDVPGQPGWYRSVIQVQPHIKYEGASFTLSLVGRVDGENVK